jgi:hypothetical protein
MDSQLYMWARKQEIQHELARRALVSEAKALRARDGAGRRNVMFGTKRHLRATTPTEEEERQRAPVISDSPAGAQENGNGRAWRWRVEPGMEDAFQDLLGWMLPGQRGAEVETASRSPQPSAPVAAEQLAATQPTALETGERRPASELRPLAA